MSVKILKLFLMILGVMVISGCASKPTFVDRIIEVPVIQECKIPKPVQCTSGKRTYTEEVNQMRLCIREYRELVKVCEKGGK